MQASLSAHLIGILTFGLNAVATRHYSSELGAALTAWHFVYSPLVSAAFKLGGKELVHYLRRHLRVDKAAWHNKHIGIVMLTNKVGNLGNPAKTSTDALVLVKRHVDTFTTTTNGNARINLTFLDTLS